MREWLITLIREAVRAEVAAHFTALEDNATRMEAALSAVTVRAKEKSEHKPSIGKQWGATARKLERESEVAR